MSIHIILREKDFTKENSNVQSIPFKILADCDAPVSLYLDRFVKSHDVPENTFKGSFRGYPLLGENINVPKGYVGFVLHESITPSTDTTDRKFYVINKFNSLKAWNWDKLPSYNDKLKQSMDWIDVAEALHTPITDD